MVVPLSYLRKATTSENELYHPERKAFSYKHYLCLFYFHLFNVLLKKVKNVDIFHEIDKKGYISGCLSKPQLFSCLETYLYFLMICSMDIGNVINPFKKKFIDTIFFYSTLKSNFVGLHQIQLQAILRDRKTFEVMTSTQGREGHYGPKKN
jgi:hypothetical protein